MQKQVVWSSGDDSVEDVIKKMEQHDVGYVMIGKNEVLEGIVSKSDLTGAMSPYLKPIFAKWRRPLDDATLQIRAKWIMSRPVYTVKPTTQLASIIESMRRIGRRALPVVDEEGKVEGVVTVFDVFDAVLNTNSNVSTAGKAAETPPLA